ncbi:MAG: nitrogen fixation protein NifX [Nitrospirae bacterium]|nr:nitrogen fixation protein NifX [Nitrospirota bacterium]
MKVAFATTDSINVDEHFGRCGTFAIYDVTDEGYQFIEVRKFADGRDSAVEDSKDDKLLHEDLLQKKVDRLDDCRLIYLMAIGGPSAARLARKGIMPVKINKVVSIKESLTQLVDKLKTSPPPWLKKVMNSK